MSRVFALSLALTAVAILAPSTATAATVLQGFVDDEVFVEETAIVVWFVSETTNTKREWIGIYEVGASNKNPVYWEYLPLNTRFGTIRFYLDEPGFYEARFFANESYTEVAERKQLTVLPDEGPGGAGRDYRLRAERDRALEGVPLVVDWRVPLSEQGAEHWVGLYEAGESMWNRTYDWAYVPDGEFSGDLALEVPDRGRYVLRMYRDPYKELVAESRTVEVVSYSRVRRDYELSFEDTRVRPNERVSVEWEVPDDLASEDDWIGVRRAGSSRREFADWAYLGTTRDRGEVDLRVARPGTYEAVLYSSNSYTELARSENVLRVE
ncbi:hypothetical protein GVX82_03285 [Patescibacteria group bacterium]|jgi:hypothetical protein|nr:hypothetical protein [Patescibacteria group bacterium]